MPSNKVEVVEWSINCYSPNSGTRFFFLLQNIKNAELPIYCVFCRSVGCRYIFVALFMSPIKLACIFRKQNRKSPLIIDRNAILFQSLVLFAPRNKTCARRVNLVKLHLLPNICLVNFVIVMLRRWIDKLFTCPPLTQHLHGSREENTRRWWIWPAVHRNLGQRTLSDRTTQFRPISICRRLWPTSVGHRYHRDMAEKLGRVSVRSWWWQVKNYSLTLAPPEPPAQICDLCNRTRMK